MAGVKGSGPGGIQQEEAVQLLEFEHLGLEPGPRAYKLCVLGWSLFKPQFVHKQHRATSNSFVGNLWRQALEIALSSLMSLEEDEVRFPLGTEQASPQYSPGPGGRSLRPGGGAGGRGLALQSGGCEVCTEGQWQAGQLALPGPLTLDSHPRWVPPLDSAKVGTGRHKFYRAGDMETQGVRVWNVGCGCEGGVTWVGSRHGSLVSTV